MRQLQERARQFEGRGGHEHTGRHVRHARGERIGFTCLIDGGLEPIGDTGSTGRT